VKYEGMGTHEVDGRYVWLEFTKDTICIDGHCTLRALKEIVIAYRDWRKTK